LTSCKQEVVLGYFLVHPVQNKKVQKWRVTVASEMLFIY